MCPTYFPAKSFIAKALVCVARNAPHLWHVAALPRIVGGVYEFPKGGAFSRTFTCMFFDRACENGTSCTAQAWCKPTSTRWRSQQWRSSKLSSLSFNQQTRVRFSFAVDLDTTVC